MWRQGLLFGAPEAVAEPIELPVETALPAAAAPSPLTFDSKLAAAPRPVHFFSTPAAQGASEPVRPPLRVGILGSGSGGNAVVARVGRAAAS